MANPIATNNFLTWLESLIDLEEVLNLIEFVNWKILNIFDCTLANIASGDTESVFFTKP